jgi:hypothetical protein
MKRWVGVVLFLIGISAPVVLAAQTPSPTPETKRMTTFEQNLPKDLAPPTDAVEALILREYGAVFVARGNVTPPKAIVFRDEAEVSSFQNRVESTTESIEGVPMKLQTPAMRALVDAVREARDQGLTISPRDVDAAAQVISTQSGCGRPRRAGTRSLDSSGPDDR